MQVRRVEDVVQSVEERWLEVCCERVTSAMRTTDFGHITAKVCKVVFVCAPEVGDRGCLLEEMVVDVLMFLAHGLQVLSGVCAAGVFFDKTLIFEHRLLAVQKLECCALRS